MYDLFQDTLPLRRVYPHSPLFERVRDPLRRDLETIVNYHRQKEGWVQNQHPLMRLLGSIPVSFKRDPQNYVDAVRDVGLRTAGMVGMTTSVSFGRIWSPGPFYGSKSKEVLIAHGEEFDVDAAGKDWKNLQPIQVMRHPYSDLSIARPDGQYLPGSLPGISVISINVPMLAFQYRCWCEDATVSQYDQKTYVATSHFMYAYPITNMVYSHLDVALFNRMAITLFSDGQLGRWVRAHPVYGTDRSSWVDTAITQTLTGVSRAYLSFDQLLDSLPLITAPNLRHLLMVPDTAPTRQVSWALILALLPYIRFLVRSNLGGRSGPNTAYLNRIWIWLRRIKNDRLLENRLPPEIYREVREMIEREIVLYIPGA